MEVEPPRSRRRASQRIRGGTDERNTPVNYNSRRGPRLQVVGSVKIAIAEDQRGGRDRGP